MSFSEKYSWRILFSSAFSFPSPRDLYGFCVQRLQVTTCHLWSVSLCPTCCCKSHLTALPPQTPDGGSAYPPQVYIQVLHCEWLLLLQGTLKRWKNTEEFVSVTKILQFFMLFSTLGSYRARWRSFFFFFGFTFRCFCYWFWICASSWMMRVTTMWAKMLALTNGWPAWSFAILQRPQSRRQNEIAPLVFIQ